MRRPVLLALFCLLMWLPGFFTIPPTDRDESRFAQATKQMIETGDYITIHNGEHERNRKPIGIYWLEVPFAAAARWLNVAKTNPIWPYRLPSLLGGLAAVALTVQFGRDLVGAEAALMGGWILAASVILLVETHMATTDAALLAVTLAAMGLMARVYLQPLRFGWLAAMGFWAALAAGILIKGPITPMIVALTALALVAMDRRANWLAGLRWRWGVPLMLALVLPWFVAVGIATEGKFFTQAIGGELVPKLRSGVESHGAPPGFYFLLLGLTLFPGSLAVLRALPAAWLWRREAGVRFLIAWVVPSWIVFEAVPTKLPHYVLPLLPAFCLLGGRWLVSGVPMPRWVAWFSALLFGLGAALLGLGALALPFVVVPGLAWRDLLGLPALGSVALITWLLFRRGIHQALFAAPLYAWAILGLELPMLPTLWIAPQVKAALAVHGASGFGAVGYNEPSLRFLCGTDTYFAPNIAASVRFLTTASGRVVAVEGRDRLAFERAASAAGIEPRPFASITGYDYSDGQRVVLTLYALKPLSPPPDNSSCVGWESC